MAIDHGLLDLASHHGLAVLRLYRWDPFCLSFGRNEPAARRYDRRLIAERGIDVVRRPTGGRAVWHARELTYSVAAPAACFGALPAAYLAIHAVLADAVTRLGGNPVLAPAARPAPLDSGACFRNPVGGEVMVSGRKIVGSAQVREAEAFLQHGSMLLDDDQQLVADVSLGPSAPGLDAPLNALLAAPATFESTASAVAEAAAIAWSGDWLTISDGDALVADAGGLHAQQYRSDEWTWRR
jgi:lipoyl(octanoyl) transferase